MKKWLIIKPLLRYDAIMIVTITNSPYTIGYTRKLAIFFINSNDDSLENKAAPSRTSSQRYRSEAVTDCLTHLP